MNPSPKAVDIISEAGKEAVSLIINRTTGDNHPEYEKAVIEGTAEAIKELAKSDPLTSVRIYESLKIKREKRDFFNFSRVLNIFGSLVKTKPKEVVSDDNDFFWNTFEHAKEVSQEEMQELIAKILADEYSNPKTYSLHTLQILKSIDSKTLKDFQKVLALNLKHSGVFQDIFSDSETIIKLNVPYFDFLNLQSIGLISSNESSAEGVKEIMDVYIDKSIHFKQKNEAQEKITFPNFYSLTKAGKEVALHLELTPNQNYLDWVKNKYSDRYIIEI